MKTLFYSWIDVFLHPREEVFKRYFVNKNNWITLTGIILAASVGLGLSRLTHLRKSQNSVSCFLF
jgi:hypothetical protein